MNEEPKGDGEDLVLQYPLTVQKGRSLYARAKLFIISFSPLWKILDHVYSYIIVLF